ILAMSILPSRAGRSDARYEGALQESEVLAPARRTDVLIMPPVGERVVDVELFLDVLQIANVDERSVGTAAAHARGGAEPRRGAPIELDAQLRRALKDVEEFPERQIEQGEDDRHRVKLREKAILKSAQVMRRDREEQAGRGDGEEQHEGQEIARELLERQRAAVAPTAIEGEHDPRDD